MSNLESMGNNNPNQATDDMAKVHEVMKEADQGMVAMSNEGEKKRRIGPDGNPTIALTDSEFEEYKENFGN